MNENGIDNSLHAFTSNEAPSLLPIANLIHVVRGQQVIFDSDLASLYGVETKALNQAVKRNIERFPEDFMFQLSKSEIANSRSQIVTLNSHLESSGLQNATSIKKQGHNIKYLPYAFTENGVAMLSSVLRSKTAVEVNIRIMRAFTAMRGFLVNNAHIFQRLETLEHHQLLLQEDLSEHNRRLEEVLSRLNDKEAETIEGFFYDGQIFDAYVLISELVRKAEKRIILIDNYVDERVLKVLTKRKDGVTAKIYTDPRHSQITNDLRRHNAQYPRIDIENCSNVHDRFLIIDDTVYFIGGSIKDLGKKIVAFSQMRQSPSDILLRLK